MNSPQPIAGQQVDRLPELPKHSLSRSEISTLRKILKRAFRQSPWHLGALQEVYRQVRSVWVAEFTEDNVFTTDDVLREHFENTQHTTTEAIAAERAEVVRLREMVEAVRYARDWYEKLGEVCSFEGMPMCYASVLLELGEKADAALATPTQGGAL